MASQFVIDINSNDELPAVIRKCNANFKAIMSQYAKQRQIDNGDISDDIGDATQGLIQVINHETDLRIAGDQALNNAIGVVDDKFDNYTPTADLATVATTGSYADLIDVPTIPIDGAYTTFGIEDPSTIYGGTWITVGTLAVGSETLTVWKKTA